KQIPQRTPRFPYTTLFRSYRGLVKVLGKAEGARNFSQCDSLLLGDKCGAHTFPYIEVDNPSAIVEHEATTSRIGEDQIFYCNQRDRKSTRLNSSHVKMSYA